MDNEDHKRLELSDILALVGELEHVRRHALRSSHVTKDDKKKVHYEMTAVMARNVRRELMNSIGGVPDEDWCLVKTASAVRQLAYEIGLSGEAGQQLEQMVDQIYTQAFGQDMSGCRSCAEDRKDFSEKQ